MKQFISLSKFSILNNSPSFHQVDELLAAHSAKLSIPLHLHSPWRWTPLIQKQQQSEEFLKKMRHFQKLQTFEDKHRYELVDAFIFEALKETGFQYYYDYKCNASPACSYHGVVDFMVYNSTNPNKLPLIPIVQIPRLQMKSSLLKEREINSGPSVAMALWALKNMHALAKVQHSYVVQTNGNHWRLIKLGMGGEFEKTGVYYSTTNAFEKIYFDYDTQQVVLGLIKFTLDQQTDKEEVLKSIYDFVDERRYLSEPTAVERVQYEKRQRFWSFLPKSITNLFFQ